MVFYFRSKLFATILSQFIVPPVEGWKFGNHVRQRNLESYSAGRCNLLSSLLTSELVDKCIGSRIHIVMKTDKEIVGTLLGFDDFVSILCKEQRRRSCFRHITFLSVNVFQVCHFVLISTLCHAHELLKRLCFFTMFQFLVVFGLHYVSVLYSPGYCPLTQSLRHGAGGCYRIVCTFLFIHLLLSFLFFLTNGLFFQCKSMLLISHLCFSEITPEGRRITKLDQILLNGNNITMVREESVSFMSYAVVLLLIVNLFTVCSSSLEEKVLKSEMIHCWVCA